MAGTTRSTTSRAAKTAGPGEILVPINGELTPCRERQAEFDAFLSRAGRPSAAWSANTTAGVTLARTQGAESIELWAHPDGQSTGHVLLVRFTRKTNGTVPFAEVVGAARLPGAPVAEVAAVVTESTGDEPVE
jgi:hypothetical protein